MTYVRIGEFQANAVDMMVDVKPMEAFKPRPLGRMNFLLGYLAEVKPDIVSDFATALNTKLQGLVTGDLADSFGIDVDEVYADASHLQPYTELARNHLNYYLQVLDLPEDGDVWGSVKVTIRNEILSHHLWMYYALEILIDLLGRDEAVKFFKQYITHYLIEMKKGREDRVENLEALLDNRLKAGLYPGQMMTVGMMADGKYACKIETCLLKDSMEEIEDIELKYLVCCYGDYQMVKFSNQHFILTMEHTIIEGDDYCSRVIHDTRADWDLRHPPKEFWDAMEANN